MQHDQLPTSVLFCIRKAFQRLKQRTQSVRQRACYQRIQMTKSLTFLMNVASLRWSIWNWKYQACLMGSKLKINGSLRKRANISVPWVSPSLAPYYISAVTYLHHFLVFWKLFVISSVPPFLWVLVFAPCDHVIRLMNNHLLHRGFLVLVFFFFFFIVIGWMVETGIFA